MFDFIGYKCPVCSQRFAKGDDIVVCPDCGAPYHRACYFSRSRCLFEDQHGPDFEWAPSQEDQEAAQAAKTITCPDCGAECPGNSHFCLKCGCPLSGQEADQASQARRRAEEYGYGDAPFNGQTASEMYRHFFGSSILDDIPVSEWETFIGGAAPAYLAAFGRMMQTGRKIGINISAFIFGPIYFFYRKMWKWAAIFSAIFFALNTPYLLLMLYFTESTFTAGMDPDFLYSLSEICSWLTIGVSTFRGLMGHYLYRKDAGQKIRQIQAALPHGPQRTQALRQTGGVSWKGVGFFLVIFFAFDFFVVSLMGPNITALYSLLGV